MQKSLKAGILITALVVPALIFLYLKGFGENHYEFAQDAKTHSQDPPQEERAPSSPQASKRAGQEPIPLAEIALVERLLHVRASDPNRAE